MVGVSRSVLESTKFLPRMCDDGAHKEKLSFKLWTRYVMQRRGTLFLTGRPCIWTEAESLHKILTMYWELIDMDLIITLNLLAAELKRLDRSVKGLSLAAIWHHSWHHIKKHGVVQHHVTHVAQNTRYKQSIIQGWVSYVNQSIKIGNYKVCGVVNIDETNVDFDLASRATLAVRGERKSGCAATGSSTRCAVLIGVAMDCDKLPPFIIYKGTGTPHSLIKREWKDLDTTQTYGYLEGQVYTVQEQAWMVT
jgi:hypothetical protein